MKRLHQYFLLALGVSFLVQTTYAINLKELDQMTKQFVTYLEHSGKIIHDEEANHYIQNLGKRLSKNVQSKYEHYHFFLVNDKAINAFAGPGGYIGIHSALILMAKNEDELAGVIAHEMGHVKQRHMIRQLERMNAEKVSMTIASIAGIILGAAYSPELGQAAIMSGAAGIQQIELNFSRSQEAEADRIGIEILEKAHYTPHSLLAFFKRLLTREQLSFASVVPTILKSHPLTEHRIAEIQNRLKDKAPKIQKPSIDFELFKARISFIMQTDENVEFHHEIAEIYYQGLSLLEHARFTDFNELLPKLKRYQQKHYIKALLIDYAAKAHKPLQKGLVKKEFSYSHNEIIASKLFEYHLTLGNFSKAEDILHEAMSETPNSPEVWFAYAELESQQKHEAEAYLYRARGMYIKRKLHEAKRLLKLASVKKAHNPYTKEKIKALKSELTRSTH